MKISLFILAVFCATVLCVPKMKMGEYHVDSDKTYLERQRQVLQLFFRINQQDDRHPEYEEIRNTFSIQDHADFYNKPEVVKNFMQYWKYGLLPRNKIFSLMNKEHLEQAIAMFRVFYYAKDWDTLYKTAVWARHNVNQGIFVYAFTVALVHRTDTRNIMLPPIYEVFPHYFFSSDVINKAAILKQTYSQASHDTTYHTIESNYSGWYLNLHPEQSMSYFTEDVGINAFIYSYSIYYPSWMSSEEFGWKGSRRGEIFYYVISQIMARQYQERLSNGFGETPFLDCDSPIETPYEPSLVYPNGLHFPNRPRFAKLHEYFYNYGQKWSNNLHAYSYSFIKDYERRIYDAIDSGVVFNKEGKMIQLYTEDGLNILGNLISANADSPNNKYFGSILYFASHLLGYSWQALDQQKLVPSALEHFETMMRDPIYYQILKKVLDKFQRYMSNVKPYSERDLVFPGVKVTDMKVDSLVTYEDYFYSDLNNAVWYYPQEKYDFRVRVRQTRLNHKPFNVHIHVNSNKKQKAAIRLCLAPKYDELGRQLNLTENSHNMVELDQWIVQLKSGANEIMRNSRDFTWYANDRMSHVQLYDSVVSAIKNDQPFQPNGKQNGFYWPRRYMLPKGTEAGMTFQFFVIVYPWEGDEVPHVDPNAFLAPGSSEIFIDNKSLRYPFDRMIKFEKMWYQIPNIHFQDEKIYHKDEHEINSPHH